MRRCTRRRVVGARGEFPDDEAEDVGEQRVEGSDGSDVGEAGGAQDGVDGLELLEDGPDGEPSLGEDAR